MGYLCYRFQVGYLQLRIGHHLQEYSTGLVVDSLSHSLQVGEIAQSRFHPKPLQRGGDKSQRITKEVMRRYDIPALCGHGQQRVTDSCHARVEGRHVVGTRQGLHTLFEVGHRGILHTCVVGSLDTVTESIRHLCSIIKFKSNIIIHRYGQCSIDIWPYKRVVDCNCLFVHPYQFFYLNIFIYRTLTSQ